MNIAFDESVLFKCTSILPLGVIADLSFSILSSFTNMVFKGVRIKYIQLSTLFLWLEAANQCVSIMVTIQVSHISFHMLVFLYAYKYTVTVFVY